jgi:hypothetical protein
MSFGILCLRMTVIVVLIIATTACVTSIPDLSTGPVSVLTAPRVGQLPERPIFSVSLRTRTNLSRLPTEELIHANTFFCDSPKDFVLLGRTIYVDPPLTVRDSVAKPDAAGTYTYFVLLEVSRRASANSWPVQVGFDLAAAPRAVCMKLEGGYIAQYARSNTVRVPAESIREAWASYERSGG